MITFTQFIPPNGIKRDITISRPQEIENQANDLIKYGCSFEIEILSTGHVSMEIMLKNNWSLANELVPNGPEVLSAVDRLIKRAHIRYEYGQDPL